MMKLKMMLVAVMLLSVVSVGFADTFNEGTANEFTIDFVTISSSASDGYGGQSAGTSFTTSNINNDYRMGKYEITNDQFAKFASNNPYWTGADVPSNKVSWYEAAQFVNYLNTSTGNDAAYKFSGGTMSAWDVLDNGFDASNPYRNSNAKYFLPSEDEWVKAAYWNGTCLQTYASVGDVIPSVEDTNFHYSPRPWDVGSGSEELNGTYDMMGNIWEWTESPYISGDYLPDSDRIIHGGSYNSRAQSLSSSYLIYHNPDLESIGIGFRVASIPEPCTLVLLGLGGLMLHRRKS